MTAAADCHGLHDVFAMRVVQGRRWRRSCDDEQRRLSGGDEWSRVGSGTWIRAAAARRRGFAADEMIYRITTTASDCRGHRLPRAPLGTAAAAAAAARHLRVPNACSSGETDGVGTRERDIISRTGGDESIRFQPHLLKKNAVKSVINRWNS